MKFKVVGKCLILTDYSHKITRGEDSFDAVEITVPRYHDNCDLSTLSFRFSEVSEDGENSAVQILRQEKCDEDHVNLCGEITSDFSAITGNVTFMLTGVDSENVVAKFQSAAYLISDDPCLASMPNETAAEQLFNQAQLETQKAIEAANDTRKMLEEFTIDVASENTLGGILSGGDISVSESGDVTVQSVKGKTLGKSVPEDAVFTDTVYKLPKATTKILGGVKVDGTSITVNGSGVISAVGGKNGSGKLVLPIASEDTLGGVKVDGKTITANEDGTISALDSENLKTEIADIKSYQSSISNLSVQIAHPNNFLIYDDAGKPSVMVAIPKFYLDEVIDGASHTVHPAFIVNGAEQDVIYISKYQNVVENGRAYSLPLKDPRVSINFDTARQACEAKGEGWHLMTNAEWAAIALWCKKNGTIPKGNNDYGKDISEVDLPRKAIAASVGSNEKTNRILTGSGRESWYHDGTFAGIADLNGNVCEWQTGLRLNNGEIQIIADNNAAVNGTDVSASSAQWKAINSAGQLVAPGSTGTLKYKAGTITTDTGATCGFDFEAIKAAAGVTIPEIMKALALAPNGTGYADGHIWINAEGERIACRSGSWVDGVQSGVFSLYLYFPRSYTRTDFGFRSCYYNPN